MKRLLIDGDAIVYKVGFACEQRVECGTGESAYTWQEPASRAVTEIAVDNMIESIQDSTGAVLMNIYLTDSDIRNNDRYRIDPTYKGHRSVPKPLHYNNIRNYLIHVYGAQVVSGIEADDMLGIMQDNDSVIVSHDKDLLQVPGKHYSLTFKKIIDVKDPGVLVLKKDKAGKKRLYGYGFKWFCAQMLMGDSADNIKGLARVGDVKAWDILKDETNIVTMYDIVRDKYKSQEKLFNINKQLLWIQRKEFKTALDFVSRYADNKRSPTTR